MSVVVVLVVLVVLVVRGVRPEATGLVEVSVAPTEVLPSTSAFMSTFDVVEAEGPPPRTPDTRTGQAGTRLTAADLDSVKAAETEETGPVSAGAAG